MQELQSLWQTITEYTLFGTPMQNYVYAILIFITTWTGLNLIKKHIINRLYKTTQKTKLKYDNLVIGLLKNINAFTYFTVSLFISTQTIQTSTTVSTIIKGIFLLALVIEATNAATHILQFYFTTNNKRKNKTQKTNFQALKKLLQVTLLTFGLLAVLDNLGFDVNSLVTSLGIGGIAIALAVQNILGDLFSSLAIYLDRPFEVGDFIEVDPQTKGRIKSIGIKSTRLRGLKGDEIIVSNKHLTSSSVTNGGRIENRRVEILLGLDYQTTDTKLRKVPDLFKKIIDGIEGAEYKYAYINELGDYSINYKLVYKVLSGKFSDFYPIHHETLLQLNKTLKKEKINLAFPTQSIFMDK